MQVWQQDEERNAQPTLYESTVQIPEPEKLERAKGIEPSSSAWEADALPLCYARIHCIHYATSKGHGKWI